MLKKCTRHDAATQAPSNAVFLTRCVVHALPPPPGDSGRLVELSQRAATLPRRPAQRCARAGLHIQASLRPATAPLRRSPLLAHSHAQTSRRLPSHTRGTAGRAVRVRDARRSAVRVAVRGVVRGSAARLRRLRLRLPPARLLKPSVPVRATAPCRKLRSANSPHTGCVWRRRPGRRARRAESAAPSCGRMWRRSCARCSRGGWRRICCNSAWRTSGSCQRR